MLLSIQSALRALANPDKAKVLSGFFKTGKGQYGEGDVFLGIQVPDTRKVVKQYLPEMNLEKVEILLQSEFHEERLAGVLCLVEWAKEAGKNHYFVCHSAVKGNGTEESLFPILTRDTKLYSHKRILKGMYHEGITHYARRSTTGQKGKYSIQELAEFYLSHREYINNWDFVDTSAPYIIGPYIEECLGEKERTQFIEDCITSPHLWTNRIIVLASFYHINKLKDARLTFYIVKEMLGRIPTPSLRGTTRPPQKLCFGGWKQSRKMKALDSGINQEGQNDIHFNSLNHDLMHKACGWMLRESGKQVSETKLCEFLDEYAQQMPRTMLRYAIERLDKEKKEKYMKKA